MSVVVSENFASYSQNSALPNGANGGSGFSAGWQVPNGEVNVMSQSGSWLTSYALLTGSSGYLQREFPAIVSGVYDITFQGYRANSGSLFYCGLVLGGNQYFVVFGAGFNQVRYNGSASSISDPIPNGSVFKVRLYVDTNSTTNNVKLYINDVLVFQVSTNITSKTSPVFSFYMSGYGSGSAIGDIKIDNGLSANFNQVFFRVLI